MKPSYPEFACLIFAFLFFNSEINSQIYFPFPTENVNWNVYYLSSCDDDNPPDTFILRYSIHRDTIINTMLYNRLCLEIGDTLSPEIQPVGGIRENEKKIYFNGESTGGSSTGREVLLYDFTKNTGDTILNDTIHNFYSVIEDIDSVWIDGNYRKRYQVLINGFFHNPDYIIEGIGSVKNGLLGHISDVPSCGHHYWEHICFREGGTVKYLNPAFRDCFPANLMTSFRETPAGQEIRIFPNPAVRELYIENNTIGMLNIRIVDTNGRIIKQFSTRDKLFNFEIANVPGIFNVVISNDNGKILKSEKIMFR